MTVPRYLLLILIAGSAFLSPSHGQAIDAQSFADGVRRADKVVLYEGLPHQMFERQLLENERRLKAVQVLDGFPFYQATLELKVEDAKRLTEVFSNPAKLGLIPDPRLAPKKCGGFHPDYALEWNQGAKRFRALICFGCREVKLFGPAQLAEYDLDEKIYRNLESILKEYRKNRPAKGDRSSQGRVVEDRSQPAGKR